MAFDKVDHISLLTALERLGLHDSYIDVIRDFYSAPPFTPRAYTEINAMVLLIPVSDKVAH